MHKDFAPCIETARQAAFHNGTHSALQRDLGEDVVAQVAQHSAGVGQLGAAQVDLVVRHHPDEFKDLLPAGGWGSIRLVKGIRLACSLSKA